jgi:hypothetical protein
MLGRPIRDPVVHGLLVVADQSVERFDVSIGQSSPGFGCYGISLRATPFTVENRQIVITGYRKTAYRIYNQ